MSDPIAASAGGPIDLRQLERFVVTAEAGAIGAAAVRLGLSQPALTRSLHMLEAEVGGALFDRLPRGVKLTAVGEALLPHAKLILNNRARLAETIDTFKGLAGGSVVFGVSPNLAETVGAEAVLTFARRHPKVGVTVHIAAHGELVTGLQDGGLDMALSTVGSEVIPDDLSFEPLFEQMLSIVVRAQHPLAALDSISFDALSRHTWIVTNGQAAIEGLKRTFEARGAPPPFLGVRCQSLSLQTKLLLSEDYVAIIDQEVVRADISSGRIKVLRTENEGVSLRSGLLQRRQDARASAAQAFARAVRDGARSRRT